MSGGRIPLEELVKLPAFYLATPSWSGEKIAFYWDKPGRIELFVMDIRTRTVKQITDGQAPRSPRSGFVWTRDDAAIIFGKDWDGDEQNNLFQVDLSSRAVTQLNDDPRTQEHAGHVSPDNHGLAVMSNRAGQMNLFTFDLARRDWTQLTDFKAPVNFAGWSPDGEWLAFNSNESVDLRNVDGYLIRKDGTERRKVLSVKEGSRDTIDALHPDGRQVAVSSDATGSNRPGILDLETGEVRWLGADGVEEYARRFSANGQWLITLRNQDSALTPILYHVESGQERPLHLPPGMTLSASFVLRDTKLMVHQSASNRMSELLLYDLASNVYEVLLPAEYGSIEPSVFVTDEYVHYPSFDDQLVPAILYRPREMKPGQRLPALINVHGGPTHQWYRGFDPYAQFLVDQGYVILEPNVRGSTGYGTAWRDANLMDWGGGDLEDVAAGASYLRTLDYVDPDRIGIMGGSYGGYLSYMAVVKKPDQFKVGIPIVGISDLFALYQENMEHFRYLLRHFLGDPAKNQELWQDRSAVTHAANLKAKLLILHGMNDPRCPISQARNFRDRIVAAGKQEGTAPQADFEYHELANQGHGSADIAQKLHTYRLLSDFLARRL